MIKLFLLAIWLQGPATDSTFGRFAQHQDSLFVSAYNAKDTAGYNRLMAQFLDRYDRLSKDEQSNFKGYYAGALYNLSCTYALVGDKTRALDCLDESVQQGYTDYGHIKVDGDLVPLHDEPRFHAILAQLRTVADYRYILTRAEAYNTQDHRPLPAFTYAPATDPHLVSLRQGLKLDSIAGTGNDISKVINLLHWIHNLVPHDGSHPNPDVKNAMALIEVCKRDNRGLNCRGLATVLNECYLSLGFKSRFVTCLPKDSLHTDPDCHVINMVFLPSKQRWVWMDPTNDAYVMDEKGRLLDLREVRERVIKDEPLIVNPDANWNHRTSTLKEDYLYNYMAKNLYMLECATYSGYDMETQTPGKTLTYIKLIPLDYFKQSPDRAENNYPKQQVTYITYLTNNPDTFWAKPE